PLPARRTQKFQSAHEVIAGNSASALRIYVLEGEDNRSDRNYGIGLIALRGDELRRSLPAGEAVEIIYRLDESKNLSVEAVFPSLREAKQMIYRPERPALTSVEIDIELQKEKERLHNIERVVPQKLDRSIADNFVLVERQKEAAANDPDARQKAAQQLIELKQVMDALERSSEWELLVADVQGFRESGLRVVQERGTAEAKT